jgi:alkaline phosphatase
VAHNASRNNYEQIAQEMVYQSAADVIMGAGHPCYNSNGGYNDCSNDYKYVGGLATWDDLLAGTAGGDADGDGLDDPWTLVQSREDFQALMSGETPDRVLGVSQVRSTLQQGRYGDELADPYVVPFIETVPTLAEMARAALNVLDDDPEGLFLLVEGGAVDWAGHSNQSGRMIEEQIAFDQAVKAVVEWVEANSNWDETLLVVTGDHETGYLNGPGSDPGWEPVVNRGAGVLPGMEWHSGSHTNSLIPFFAWGAGAWRFAEGADGWDPVRGAYIDNTEIGQVILAALAP